MKIKGFKIYFLNSKVITFEQIQDLMMISGISGKGLIDNMIAEEKMYLINNSNRLLKRIKRNETK